MNTSFFAQYYYPMMSGQCWDGGIIMMILWPLLVILFVFLAIRVFKTHDVHSMHHQRDPLDIAKERYAKGDITKEQFEQIKTDVSSR